MPSESDSFVQYRTLTLAPDGKIRHNDVVRIDVGTILRIVVEHGTPASLLPFYINYPDTQAQNKFNRHKFRRIHPVERNNTENILNWDSVYEIKCDIPGAYQYFLEKIPHGFLFVLLHIYLLLYSTTYHLFISFFILLRYTFATTFWSFHC